MPRIAIAPEWTADGAMAAEIVELRAEVARLTEALGREHETARMYMDINSALREENNELDNRLVVAREAADEARKAMRVACNRIIRYEGCDMHCDPKECPLRAWFLARAALAEQEGVR